ncbi:MAG: hypothetical protein ACQEVT_00430 [Pseudomonadota bacterium]|uniref:hypothetical protein n=1 Tax=Roseovarius TaxID=74030 RepID=UPI0022A6CD13|nr:hypothetical protein [Roseovarius sp. EGI FJ00037]MCZ0811705.1 hypothetical protein [Roseovarius sp. EGI FJ00037]
MSIAEDMNPVVARLETVLETSDVPAPYHRWGARLLSHLRKPVQVVVTGLPGSGKTALLNMLAGKNVLGAKNGAEVSEIAHGSDARTLFEQRDGSVSQIAGLARDAVWPQDVRRVRQELPDPELARRSLIEIGLPAHPDAQITRLQEIVAQADIILWCTDGFTAAEQRLWSAVPDPIKDHSLLVVTMADRQMMRGVLGQTIAALDPIVAEEFLGLYPVATMQGLSALTAGDGVDGDLWASSGGRALSQCIAHQVELGRSSDVDQAQLLLDRLAARSGNGRACAVSAPAPAQPKEPAQAANASEPSQPTGTGAVLDEAATLLQKHAGSMLELLDGSEDMDSDALLDQCVDAVAALTGIMEAAPQDDPDAASLRVDLQDGEEMLLLFQLERGEEAALDAVTLLLQLRKEMVGRTAGRAQS